MTALLYDDPKTLCARSSLHPVHEGDYPRSQASPSSVGNQLSQSEAKSEARLAVARFLERCGLVCPNKPSEHLAFADDCIRESLARGYITPSNDGLRSFIPGGVAMSRNAYPHQSRDIQIFICLYTAFLIYIDDMAGYDIGALEQFNYRFSTGQPQSIALLEHFASLLKQAPSLFGTIPANIITTSTLNLVTARLIEHVVEDHEVCGRGIRIHAPSF